MIQNIILIFGESNFNLKCFSQKTEMQTALFLYKEIKQINQVGVIIFYISDPCDLEHLYKIYNA